MIHMTNVHGAHRRQNMRTGSGALRLTARYACELARATVKNRLLWALIAIEALLVCLALAMPPGQWVPTPFNRADALAGASLAIEGAQSTEAILSRLSEEGRPLSAANRDALEDARTSAALAEDLLAAENDRAFYTALARQLRWFEQQTRSGELIGGNAGNYALEASFLERLITLDDPRVFEQTADMPLLILLTVHWQRLGRIPLISSLADALTLANRATDPLASYPSIGYAAHLLFAAPLVTVALVATRWQTHRYLAAQAPVPRAGALAATLVVSTALAAAALVAIMLPTALVTLLRNGIGDTAYPVAYYFGTEPILTTTGLALGALARRILLVALCTSSLALCMTAISRRFLPGAVVLGILAAFPLMPQYFDHLGPLADVVPWLPSTYLCIPETVGAGESIPTLESAIMGLPGVTPERGRAVLGATVLTALALSAGAELYRWGASGLRHDASPTDDAGPSGGAKPADDAGQASGAKPIDRRSAAPGGALASVVIRAPAIAIASAALIIVAATPAVLPLRTGLDPFTQEHYRELIRQHDKRRTRKPPPSTPHSPPRSDASCTMPPTPTATVHLPKQPPPTRHGAASASPLANSYRAMLAHQRTPHAELHSTQPSQACRPARHHLELRAPRNGIPCLPRSHRTRPALGRTRPCSRRRNGGARAERVLAADAPTRTRAIRRSVPRRASYGHRLLHGRTRWRCGARLRAQRLGGPARAVPRFCRVIRPRGRGHRPACARHLPHGPRHRARRGRSRHRTHP